MGSNLPCPDAKTLQRLSEGTLSLVERARLTTHLETCPACRRKAAGFAATAKIQTPPPTHPETPRTVILTDAEKTDFLDPPRRPGLLGQLGPFDIVEVIGRGAMGVVLKAVDPALERTVAIKVLAQQLGLNASARERFLREARAVAAISHQNVVRLHAIEDQGRHPYLVMEYVAGASLQERLDRSGPMEMSEVLRIGEQIAAGLAAAHLGGVVHRDVKPANILLEAPSPPTPLPQGERGEQLRVKLTDFGLAREGGGGLTQVGAAVGTPLYMSPEQARGEAVDHRTDLFALGGVLYRLCAGRPPFEAGNSLALLRRICEEEPRPVAEINTAVPVWLTDLIGRLMAKDPARRPAGAAEVADLFRYYLDHPDHDAKPPRRPLPIGRFLAVASLLLLAGLATTEVLGRTRLLATAVSQVTGEGTLTLDVDEAIEVTVAGKGFVHQDSGPRELRLMPGRYDVRAVLDGQVLHEETLTLPRAGQLEVAVHEAAWLASCKPFVIQSNVAGDPRQDYDTLAEAIVDARHGDTIEIRGNGPFAFKPIVIDGLPLIIRAAPGFHPILRHTPEATGPLLQSNAALVLEGLEFDGLTEVEDKERKRYHVYSIKAPVFLANCRFTLNGPNNAVVTNSSPRIEICNCDFSVFGWCGLAWGGLERCSFRMENTLLRPAPTLFQLDPRVQAVTLDFTHNTWVNSSSPIEFRTGSPTQPAMQRPLSVRALENVFDNYGPAVVLNEWHDMPVVADDAQALFQRFLSWKGERNLFREQSEVGRFANRKPLEGGRPVKTLENWEQFWGPAAEKESLTGAIKFHGSQANNLGPQALVGEFALQAGSAGSRTQPGKKDLGADVGIVGPGAPYERWKKTPEYKEWLRKIRDITTEKEGR
jgi:serine/threonine protein kinase